MFILYIMWKTKSMLSNILNIYCKNIFNNFLIAESCRTCTHLFQKLPSPAPAPESRNAPVLHRFTFSRAWNLGSIFCSSWAVFLCFHLIALEYFKYIVSYPILYTKSWGSKPWLYLVISLNCRNFFRLKKIDIIFFVLIFFSYNF